MATSYCDFAQNAGKDTVHRLYNDHEYGFPIHDDNLLFARLLLEINQAGLSWETILKKKDNFFNALDNFNIDKVARYRLKQAIMELGPTGYPFEIFIGALLSNSNTK